MLAKSSWAKVAAAVAIPAFILTACDKPAIEEAKTDNSEITYSVMFNRHGCEVGRFVDAGRNIYVTFCPSEGTSNAQWSHGESCGKNCTKTVPDYSMQARP